MDDEQIYDLESAWDSEGGFLGQLRLGIFNSDSYCKLMDTLVHISGKDPMPMSIAAMLCWIPEFLDTQLNRFRDRFSKENIKLKIASMKQAIEKISTET